MSAPKFRAAVARTPGAVITSEGLKAKVVRFQKPEQAGAKSIRTGVYYLPAGSSDIYDYQGSSGQQFHGGPEKYEGETLIRRPLVVTGESGGWAAESAYKKIAGKAAFQKLLWMTDALSRETGNQVEAVRSVLQQFGSDPQMAADIVQHAARGNQLLYAVRENIIAHAVRNAGYDAVVAHSGGKLTEIFNVLELAYPAPTALDADCTSADDTYSAPGM